MSITLSSASLPVFQTALSNLLHCLEKAEANAAARGFDPNVFCTARLAPDMLPFTAQIRIACDAAKNGTARLAGIEAPKFEDNETTIAELKARIVKTLDWLATGAGRQHRRSRRSPDHLPRGPRQDPHHGGRGLPETLGLPNVFFHVTTAYALLRHNGVDLGKADYLAGAQASV